jgi:hypothetical protein
MKVCLLILFILFSTIANAQITKGTILSGGNLNFSSVQNHGGGFSFSGQIGRAYKENSIRGFNAGYSHGKSGNTFVNSYSGGIYYRKYIPVIKDFYFVGEVNLNIGYSKLNSYSYSPTSTITTYYGMISLIPGVSYAVNSRLHLEIAFSNIANLQIGYNKSKNINGGVTSSYHETNFGLSTATQHSFSNIQFGFRLLLQKKRT